MAFDRSSSAFEPRAVGLPLFGNRDAAKKGCIFEDAFVDDEALLSVKAPEVGGVDKFARFELGPALELRLPKANAPEKLGSHSTRNRPRVRTLSQRNGPVTTIRCRSALISVEAEKSSPLANVRRPGDFEAIESAMLERDRLGESRPIDHQLHERGVSKTNWLRNSPLSLRPTTRTFSISSPRRRRSSTSAGFETGTGHHGTVVVDNGFLRGDCTEFCVWRVHRKSSLTSLGIIHE